ncbi:hypothetical protein CANCADRAFT_123560 [Tortispora caseinolytica NRRL Y-17796]|uniref:Uncharacterized protein n=1 Tax=Tortispora caseinolytica NRRL Y-17796 TaxID=767744 RepID=A0A1E4TI28_9ASCO|nr:hypothetical protein CANCADRAFT_123560 [Tortispora caseinolytica NRRL Y-17796]
MCVEALSMVVSINVTLVAMLCINEARLAVLLEWHQSCDSSSSATLERRSLWRLKDYFIRGTLCWIPDILPLLAPHKLDETLFHKESSLA